MTCLRTRTSGYAYCIRQCQEAVELSLKAALRFVGIETKWHDVGITLIENRERFPEWFRKEIEEMGLPQGAPPGGKV